MAEPAQTTASSAFDEVDEKIHEAEKTAQECEDLLEILENTP